MKQKNKVMFFVAILVPLIFGIEILSQQIIRQAARQDQLRQASLKIEYRMSPISFFDKNWNRKAVKAYLPYTRAVLAEIQTFPISPENRERIGYEDSFGTARSYGGDRSHEGCDLMDRENRRGEIGVVSMTDGTVSKLGWLQLGGYRVGIMSDAGMYYYYAHLDSYVQGLKMGDSVKAGQLIGFMGDTGYGSEGTTGQFPVHLHVGIYYYDAAGQENSINPYPFLERIDPVKNIEK